MDKIIQPVRGMGDILPAQAGYWRKLEDAAREVLGAYGYSELRVPVVEYTELFKRSIGEFTDIVEKEMYTFIDKGGDSLTLRPEATAGIARAAISNGLTRSEKLRVWCMGPMFRHERPQKGRYRQFHQIDVEALGHAGPDQQGLSRQGGKDNLHLSRPEPLKTKQMQRSAELLTDVANSL